MPPWLFTPRMWAPAMPTMRVLDRNAGNVFGLLHGFLNAADGLVEFGDDALAQAARLG